jgi:serine protease Do
MITSQRSLLVVSAALLALGALSAISSNRYVAIPWEPAQAGAQAPAQLGQQTQPGQQVPNQQIQPGQQPVPSTPEQEASIAGAEQLSRAFRAAARAVSPSVVRIDAMMRTRVGRRGGGMRGLPEEFRGFFGEEMFREFQAPEAPRGGGRGGAGGVEPETRLQRAGIGSGVIVSNDGYILTNNHVIEGAAEIGVQLSDGRSMPGRLVGADPKSDLAVLKIDANGLAAAQLGDSNMMDVGDWVIAVGSPFELDLTVTAGIISATNRSVDILDYEDFLQTDAAINPGNSGGPLVNLRGEVIGINTAINSRTGSNTGVGFAIPSSMARLIMNDLIETGRVVRGFIGAGLATLTPELAQEIQLPPGVIRGVLVQRVTENGPAARAGLRPGDVVLRVDGQPVRSSETVRNKVSLARPGTGVRFNVIRAGTEMELIVQVEELTDQRLAEATGQTDIAELALSVMRVTPDIARQLGADPNMGGVVVVDMRPGAGARMGLQTGDIILEINGQEITEPEQVGPALRAGQRGLRMVIRRGNTLLMLRSN